MDFGHFREKWGENGPENEKNGPENGKNGPKMVRKWNFGPLSPFSGPCFPHFSGKAKIHFPAIFVPISGLRPEMDLYEVHGIPIPVCFGYRMGFSSALLIMVPSSSLSLDRVVAGGIARALASQSE